MQLARDLGWHFRIRAKLSVWVYLATKKRRKIKALFPSPGGARFFKNVWGKFMPKPKPSPILISLKTPYPFVLACIIKWAALKLIRKGDAGILKETGRVSQASSLPEKQPA